MTTEPGAGDPVRVQVVHALPDRCWRVDLVLAPGATVAEALALAGLERLDPELEIDPGRLAVFSRPVQPDTVLRDGDRLEVLRPLASDPKQNRRDRAADAARGKRGSP